MCHKEHGLALESPADALAENMHPHMCIDRAEGVIQKHNVLIAVDSARKAHALLLAPAEVDAALANLSLVAGGQLGKVLL